MLHSYPNHLNRGGNDPGTTRPSFRSRASFLGSIPGFGGRGLLSLLTRRPLPQYRQPAKSGDKYKDVPGLNMQERRLLPKVEAAFTAAGFDMPDIRISPPDSLRNSGTIGEYNTRTNKIVLDPNRYSVNSGYVRRDQYQPIKDDSTKTITHELSHSWLGQGRQAGKIDTGLLDQIVIPWLHDYKQENSQFGPPNRPQLTSTGYGVAITGVEAEADAGSVAMQQVFEDKEHVRRKGRSVSLEGFKGIPGVLYSAWDEAEAAIRGGVQVRPRKDFADMVSERKKEIEALGISRNKKASLIKAFLSALWYD